MSTQAHRSGFLYNAQISSDPKEVATALISGPYTKIYIRIIPRTANKSFFGISLFKIVISFL